MTHWIAPLVFAVCYSLFVLLPRRRSLVACTGAVVLVATGGLPFKIAVTESIEWNVIGLFFGVLIIAELFMESRMPAVIAEALVDRMRTLTGALLAICALSSFLSIFIENVAVVLLVAPVALSLTGKLKVSPVRILILIAICSNLQGTATLIGDPPSMILAGYMKLSFNDFFVYHGRPGIFFAVQVGAVASLFVAALLLRRHGVPIELVPVERVRSWVPGILMLILIVCLSTTSVFDPEFKWLAGTVTLVIGGVGLVWLHLVAKWCPVKKLVRRLDWDTTFFLIGVFVIVGGVSESGWLERLADWMSSVVGQNLLGTYVLIITLAVVVSAFVDNVPFLIAMIPVTQRLANALDVEVPLLMFGLLIGSCLGGNITPVGASANVVSVGMLRKHGYIVSFREFAFVGVPFTIAAVTAASIFVWFVWGP